MARIIDIYNQAQQRRSDAQADMVEMKLAADGEQRKFEGEWKRLAYLVQQRRATPGLVIYPSVRLSVGCLVDRCLVLCLCVPMLLI